MKQDFFSQFLEQTPDAIIAISTEGKIAHWNGAAESMFGFSRDEAVGRALAELIVPPDRVDEEHKIQREALERDLAVYESVRRRKDGSLVHVSVSTKAIRDHGNGGELQYFLSTKKDVTHLKVLRD